MEEIEEKHIRALIKIHEHEKSVEKTEWYLGWTWEDVKVPQILINRLMTMDLVERTYSSNRYKCHALTSKAKDVIEEYEQLETKQHEEDEEQEEIDTIELEDLTKDLFKDIAGYENLKELVRESLLTDKPIHILLVGPPALAKTLILFDIERCLPDYSVWIIGSATSKAGLWDMIADQRPRILLIDELDKMAITDTASLLSLMEKGRLVRTKMGRKMDVSLKVWVVASANRIHKLAPELISRFKVYRIKEYNAVEFVEVVTKALSMHEGIEPLTACAIAEKLVNKTHDVREAIRVARLAKRVGIDRAIELLLSDTE